MELLHRRMVVGTAKHLSRRPIWNSRITMSVIPRRSLHRPSVLIQCPFRSRSLVVAFQSLELSCVGERSFCTASDIDVIELGMPALSPTMEMGSIAVWHKKPGDYIRTGEVIADVETDKATVAFESTEDGYLAAIYVEAGVPDVLVNTIVGIMVEEEEEIEIAQTLAKPELSGAPEPPVQETSTTTEVSSTTNEVSSRTNEVTSTGQALSLSPAVGFLVSTHHIDPMSIVGTGPKGRILKGDVLQALANNTAKILEPNVASVPDVIPRVTIPAPDIQFEQRTLGRGLREFVDIPHTNMRKANAIRSSESKSTIPHNYTLGEIILDKLLQICETVKAGDQESPCINDFVIKAAALACRHNPEINSTYDPVTQTAKLWDTVDIGVAVPTDSGFITPIIEKADTLRLGQISTKVRDLITRVQDGASQPEEFIGGRGSFTISNLGMYGIKNFSTVINFPETCNLAVGANQSRVVIGTEDKPLETTTVMEVQLSCDERVVDQHTVAKWLSSFKGYMENPRSLLSG